MRPPERRYHGELTVIQVLISALQAWTYVLLAVSAPTSPLGLTGLQESKPECQCAD